jgi:hypothetical protein
MATMTIKINVNVVPSEQMALGPNPEPVEETQLVLLPGESQLNVPMHSQSQVLEFVDAEPAIGPVRYEVPLSTGCLDQY